MHCIANPYPQFHERTPAVAGTATGMNADPAVRTAEVLHAVHSIVGSH